MRERERERERWRGVSRAKTAVKEGHLKWVYERSQADTLSRENSNYDLHFSKFVSSVCLLYPLGDKSRVLTIVLLG